MTTGTYKYKSDFARRYYYQGFAEGFAEGFAKGLAEGRAKRLAESRAEGEMWALLVVLDTRGIPVSDEARTRIAGCTDLDQLETWICRAVTATTTLDLFTD